ncbi:MAG: mechanosensitive ion channel [Deltaproteobacteria bacterium]|nr:mechanosensitive ion channel [Deltaproteobacteria bacterium]
MMVLGTGLAVLWIASRLARRWLLRHVQNVDTRYRARKIVGFVTYAAAIVFASTLFSANLRQLTLALGVAGAGIAFALQEVIASVAGWAAVAFGGFYDVGDRVQLGGIRGDVIDIGVLRTTLMECGEWVRGDQYNGRIVRVANSFVFKEPVFNYSADFPFLWDEVVVPVRHGSDPGLARELIDRAVRAVVGGYVPYATSAWEKMVRKYRIEDARIEPMVTLIANDNWLEFTARYVVDFKRRRSVKDEIFTKLLDLFGATAGRVSWASATFELTTAPPLAVNLRGSPEEGKAPS